MFPFLDSQTPENYAVKNRKKKINIEEKPNSKSNVVRIYIYIFDKNVSNSQKLKIEQG